MMPFEDNTAEMQSSALSASRSAIVTDVLTATANDNTVLERMQTWFSLSKFRPFLVHAFKTP